MAGSEWAAMTYGIASAAAWGAGDFSGGLATKHNSVFSVVILSQLFGGMLLAVLAVAFSSPLPGIGVMVLGGLAGLSGVAGLLALYSGLARGRMGVVAPVAAVVTVVFPVIIGIVVEGLPSPLQMAGFLVAVAAVWLLTRTGGTSDVQLRELGLPVAAGLAFGLFFILIDQVSDQGVLWPLVSARAASVCLLAAAAMLLRKGSRPAFAHIPIILLAGTLDTAGNAFFALATRAGRLDISAVLASLYPGMTVLLAWLILKENLSRSQWTGVAAALAALAMIAG